MHLPKGIFLVLPAALFVAVCLILPVAILLLASLRTDTGWGFANYAAFLDDRIDWQIIWRTLRVAPLVTVLSALFGYPAALAIVRLPRRRRGIVLALVILPLMTSPVARTFAWIVLLGRAGLFNFLLVRGGLVAAPLRMLYTEGAVVIGLTQLFMPLMLLALVSALENLPADLMPAARTLGASEWQVFRRVTLPMTRDGLLIGGTLVFTGCVTAYVTPAMLGGSGVLLLSTLLYQRVSVSNDLASAGVIAVIMIVVTVAAMGGLRRVTAARPR